MLKILTPLSLMRFAADAAGGAGAPGGDVPAGSPLIGLITLLFPLIMLGVLYFIMIRPQRKQEKKLQQDRQSLVVGDQVVTIGGLMGRVVNIKDDEVTISTSVAGTLLTFTRDAIGQVIKAQTDEV